jgi:hypothetical protein
VESPWSSCRHQAGYRLKKWDRGVYGLQKLNAIYLVGRKWCRLSDRSGLQTVSDLGYILPMT